MTLLASLSRQELARQVTYLKAENRILRSKLPERITLSNQERRTLVKHGKHLGARLKELVSIVRRNRRKKIKTALHKAAEIACGNVPELPGPVVIGLDTSPITYLLMKADDEIGYAEELCDEIDEQLSMPGKIHKKTLRKVVRWLDKSLRFSGDKETELRVRIHFCRRIKEKRISFGGCRVSENMFATQLKKIDTAMEKVHPDLQFDYNHQLSGL